MLKVSKVTFQLTALGEYNCLIYMEWWIDDPSIANIVWVYVRVLWDKQQSISLSPYNIYVNMLEVIAECVYLIGKQQP